MKKNFSKQFKPSALFIHWTVKIKPKKKRSSRIHIPRCSWWIRSAYISRAAKILEILLLCIPVRYYLWYMGIKVFVWVSDCSFCYSCSNWDICTHSGHYLIQHSLENQKLRVIKLWVMWNRSSLGSTNKPINYRWCRPYVQFTSFQLHFSISF